MGLRKKLIRKEKLIREKLMSEKLISEETLINEVDYGSRNIPLTTNQISLLISKSFELSIKAEKIIKKRIIRCKYVYSRTFPLRF